VERFLTLVRDSYPLEDQDHRQLELTAREAVRHGPVVMLASLKANLPRLKRKHVKCVAFFKENPLEVVQSREVSNMNEVLKCRLCSELFFAHRGISWHTALLLGSQAVS